MSEFSIAFVEVLLLRHNTHTTVGCSGFGEIFFIIIFSVVITVVITVVVVVIVVVVIVIAIAIVMVTFLIIVVVIIVHYFFSTTSLSQKFQPRPAFEEVIHTHGVHTARCHFDLKYIRFFFT
jgi:sensor histidine kinase YesM